VDPGVGWTRAFHAAVTEFSHPGPWRYFPMAGPTLIGHNDIAPYNVCFVGDDLVGVFDWDMRDIGPERAARRLTVIASTYGGFHAREILHAVPRRIQIMLDGIPVAAAAGDEGMANLVAAGEPDLSRVVLADLVERIPAIDRSLG